MDWENRRYSEEEVSAIIKRALQGTSAQTITHDELLEIAQKSGVSPDKLADAIERHEELADLERAKQRWIRMQRQDFRGHLIAYVIVNGALALMNFMTTGYPWVIWPILGWGIGLAFHAVDAFMIDDEKLERGAQRLLKKERRQQRRAERAGQYSGN